MYKASCLSIWLTVSTLGGALCAHVMATEEQSSVYAETILHNGDIYTLDPSAPWAEAIAIRDGKFLAVGEVAEVMSLAGPETELVDLNGRMTMPGINDAHSHPSQATRETMFECQFPFSATPEEIASILTSCINRSPDSEWIVGGRWPSDFFNHYDIGSPRQWLDKISQDKAIKLNDETGHNAWVNSRALELAGVDRFTADPVDGKFARENAAGDPNGLLIGGASHSMDDIIPKLTLSQYMAAVKEAAHIAHSYGLTGIKDAQPMNEEIAAYKYLDDRGELLIHSQTCIRAPFGVRTTPLDYETFERIRSANTSDHVRADCVKIVLDGVPTGSRTAAMLEAYTPRPGETEPNLGLLNVPADILIKDLVELDQRGFTVKIHTGGDRAVRAALDAIEVVRTRNGDSGLRHELAHAGFIDPDDIVRFAQLNVVADLSPSVWYPSPIIDSILNAVGERGQQFWPIKTLLESEVSVQAGSDWPSAVPSINPWIGIEAMITRQDPNDQYPGALWKEQAISLSQALRIYTYEGARGLRLEDKTGSIETGKSADFIVLNHHLFDIPADEISDTEVLMTFFEGQKVYEQEKLVGN